MNMFSKAVDTRSRIHSEVSSRKMNTFNLVSNPGTSASRIGCTFIFTFVCYCWSIVRVYIQDVHKVSLQFHKFITKANEETDR